MEQLKVCSFILCVLNLIILNGRAEKVYDESKCPGPTRYYKELRCIPIFATSNNRCPYQYNCDHLKERLLDKCYIGKSLYDIGDNLAKYDSNPCDTECTCRKIEKRARFYCSVVDCPTYELKKGCYLHRSLTQCCAEVVCPQNEILPSCIVDGEIYMHGEEFIPKSNSNKICECRLNCSNKKAELYCRKNNRHCNNELYFPYNESCVPVYFPNDSPQIDCSFIYRCYNQDDRVIENHLTHTEVESKTVCKFGKLTLKYGDQLAPGTKYETCMNCTCELGPMLTCRRFSDEICKMKFQQDN